MSEQKFPPRRILTRASRTERAALAFTDQRPIDPNDRFDTRDEYLSLAEHQHLLAEKERRIERLEYCLEWLAAGFGGMWGSESKMWYDHALETAPDMIMAALQEDK